MISDGAKSILPEFILRALEEIDGTIEELRLRTGMEPRLKLAGRVVTLPGIRPSVQLLREIALKAAQHSLYSYEKPLRNGWLPLPGGGRLGIAATLADGGIRDISSLCLRFPGVHPCLSQVEYKNIYHNGFQSTLILSPPGFGKTTLLRALLGYLLEDGYMIGVADDRFEITAMRGGIPGFPFVGGCDVISGGRKDESMLMLLRSMAPDIIVCDEITSPEDAAAVIAVGNCGVALLSTAHANSKEALTRRPVYREMMENQIFQRLIRIDVSNGVRQYYTEAL